MASRGSQMVILVVWMPCLGRILCTLYFQQCDGVGCFHVREVGTSCIAIISVTCIVFLKIRNRIPLIMIPLLPIRLTLCLRLMITKITSLTWSIFVPMKEKVKTTGSPLPTSSPCTAPWAGPTWPTSASPRSCAAATPSRFSTWATAAATSPTSTTSSRVLGASWTPPPRRRWAAPRRAPRLQHRQLAP